LFDFPTAGAMDKETVRTLILLYKAVFLIGAGDQGLDINSFTAAQAKSLLHDAPLVYPGWDDTVTFVDDEIASFVFKTRSQANPFKSREGSLQMTLRVVEQVADHFANHLAEPECQEIKEDLLAFETGDTGRIRLVDFYRAGLTSRFMYVETKDYLRAMGALDESDFVHGPKVVVPNYVLSKANCLAHSHVYSICCINECDHLYSHLEDATGGYESTPTRITDLVAALSSSTVQAPRNLSRSLVERLEEIALSNGGNVLLHSRLFGQWMHQAFPRECQYPHLSGTTTSLDPVAWSEKHGVPYRIDHVPGTRMKVLNMSVDTLDREFAARQNTTAADESETENLMWTMDEETFVLPAPSLSKRVSRELCRLKGTGMMVVFFALLAAVAAKVNMVFTDRAHERSDCVFV
jgi:hypothetical protein